ncbi:MoaF-related domain-containing protein [Pseudomonas aeruginosa]|uniref:MoaF-related domain-containing protein n=1 Tax=Pseudomonas aeruginosa TaxID=287 RepID=UPI000F85F2DF|nr:adenylate cyclase [Pseudomonas aeruginosa]RTU31747.1 adenylate cyclase [Pseudomonas aeruginosa]
MSRPSHATRPAFAGRAFRVDYDGLSAHNVYSADGERIRYAIVAGPYAGAHGEAACQWREIAEGVYAISWQEADGATVVHVDDFANGSSQAFFTASDLSFQRLHGPLVEIDAAARGAQESGK